MRVSMDKTDPGYRGFNPCFVHLDGVDVTDKCQAADEELGKAWCYRLDEEGHTFVDPDDTSGWAAIEVLEGKVEITLRN